MKCLRGNERAPKAMLFETSRRMSNWSARSKYFSSRLAEPNIRKTRSSGSSAMPRMVRGLAIRRGDKDAAQVAEMLGELE